MELSIRSNQPQNDGVCVRALSVHFHLLALRFSQQQAHGRPSVPYVNIQDILLRVFLSFFKKKTELWETKQKALWTRKPHFFFFFELNNNNNNKSLPGTLFSFIVDLHSLFILYDVGETMKQKVGKTLREQQ